MKLVEKDGSIARMLKDVKIPKMFRAIQTFPREKIEREEIKKVVYKQLSKKEIEEKIKPGMSIAITAGSRGIANVDEITKSIVDFCKEKGAKPFIFPAMGSHGGATAEGQKELLAGFHITEETMGCPIKSSMETVLLGYSEYGKPVYQDKYAYEADGIIVSCRIKPHNAFRGKYESGVCKMMVVGMGKQLGAESVHSDGMENIARNIPANAKVVLEKSNILFAIPCMENAYDETRKIEAILTEKIMEREPQLLKEAFQYMPSLLVGETDILIVDSIGKNYSGTGVDPNISGTWSTDFAKGGVKVKRTCFLDLTDCSHGNANGMGLADFITRRIFDKIDFNAIYMNCMTSTVLRSGKMPPVMLSDKKAIQACIRTANQIDENHIRMIRIKNTLHVDEIMLSEEYYEDVKNGKYDGLEAIDEPDYLMFDEEENLITLTGEK